VRRCLRDLTFTVFVELRLATDGQRDGRTDMRAITANSALAWRLAGKMCDEIVTGLTLGHLV